MDQSEYFKQLPRDRRARLESIAAAIHRVCPHAVPTMKYRMPTYETNEGWIAIASQKNYLSVYTCGKEKMAAFRKSHPEIPGGKGCLNFHDRDSLHLEDLEGVIRTALGQTSRAKAKK